MKKRKNRSKQLKALKKESERNLIDPIRRQLALPISGLVTNSSPTSSTWSREQVTTLNTPGGSSASSKSSAINNPPDTGVSSEGFSTTVLPAARAKARPRAESSSGKFHGDMTETTPRGWRTTMLTLPFFTLLNVMLSMRAIYR